VMAWIATSRKSGDSPFMAVQAINPPVHDCHANLYDALFDAASPLSIAERRAIGVAVSSINHSPY
jgi:hypothetical protein